MSDCKVRGCNNPGVVLITVQVYNAEAGDTDSHHVPVCQTHADELCKPAQVSIGYEAALDVPVELLEEKEPAQLPLLPDWRCRYCGVKNMGHNMNCWKCRSRP